ncbi:MAG: ACP phosphodiesterase [Bacteroidales bacterium]|jgi:acyl carrier protein phosphodiesterase|nr:ACP phosphodiesterase [Bacteroidales bacterium]
MNFLAHAHLSGSNKDILLGNFIADAIKGKKFLDYRQDIQTGILLHRHIDTYTDSHVLFKQSVGRVRKDFGRYSGIVMDIFYDHFLALNWKDYHEDDLTVFAAYVYRILTRNLLTLPSRTKKLLPFMVSQNWLTSYAEFNGLKQVFYGMDRRTGRISGMDKAVDVLRQNYDSLYADFKEFYPRIIDFSREKLDDMTSDLKNIK